MLKTLGAAMYLIFSVGCMLYLYALIFIHQAPTDSYRLITGWEYVFRPMACAFDMFMLDIDSNIMDQLGNHALLRASISTVAVLAMAFTLSLILGLLFTRFYSYLKLRGYAMPFRTPDHLYIFFGTDSRAEHLALDIYKQHQSDSGINERWKTVLVNTSSDTVEGSSIEPQNGVDGIIGAFTQRRSLFSLARRCNGVVALASQAPRNIADVSAHADILEYIDLSTVKRLIRRMTRRREPRIDIFFLSPDNDYNINNLHALASDRTIAEFCERHPYKLYRHVGVAGGYESSTEDLLIADDSARHTFILDDTKMAVEALAFNPDATPAHYLRTKDAAVWVDEVYTAVILGFGPTGQAALDYLFEHTAFMAKNNRNKRSKVRILVADKDMESLKKAYLDARPALRDMTAGCDEPVDDDSVEIEYLNVDVTNKTNIIREIDNYISQLNYAVIALGSDELSISAARTMAETYRRANADCSFMPFIAVRCLESEHYVRMKDSARRIKTFFSTKICIFGDPQSTFTHHTVVKETLAEKAQVYFRAYALVSDDKDKKVDNWWARRDDLLARRGQNTVHAVTEIRYKEKQDIANVLHKQTKILLLKRALGTVPHYEDLSAEIRDDLAATEHLRWIAAMQIMGFTPGATKDMAAKKHNTMEPWSKIDNINGTNYQKYDRLVVKVTLRLYHKEIEPNMKPYQPKALDASAQRLPEGLEELTEELARNVHDTWAAARFEQGWKYGPERSDALKTHPCLVPYEDLPEIEKEYDRQTARRTILYILSAGAKIIPPRER